MHNPFQELKRIEAREKMDSVGVALFEDTPSNFRIFFSAEIEKMAQCREEVEPEAGVSR